MSYTTNNQVNFFMDIVTFHDNITRIRVFFAAILVLFQFFENSKIFIRKELIMILMNDDYDFERDEKIEATVHSIDE